MLYISERENCLLNERTIVFSFVTSYGSTARSGGGAGAGGGVGLQKSKHMALSGVCLLLWKRQYCQSTHLSLSLIDFTLCLSNRPARSGLVGIYRLDYSITINRSLVRFQE